MASKKDNFYKVMVMVMIALFWVLLSVILQFSMTE